MYDGLRAHDSVLPMLEREVPASADAVKRAVVSTVVSDEYLPVGVSRAPTGYRPRFAEPVGMGVTMGTTLQSGTGYNFIVSSGDHGMLELNCHWFPGWQVTTRSGPGQAEVIRSPSGSVRVVMPVRGEYRLFVHFGSTPLRTASAAASLGTAALLLLLALWPRRRRPQATP
jgi:hypothetical protein